MSEIIIDSTIIRDILVNIDRLRLQMATALNELDAEIVKFETALRKERDSDGQGTYNNRPE